jgi:hypothetical protein
LIQKVGHRLRFLWWTFAEVIGNFLDEAAFRALICWRVITGRVPQKIEHRGWDRSREAPIVVNVFDWTTYTLLFSVMVWPPVDVSEAQAGTLEKAEYFQRHRAEDVMACISRGAGRMGWSLLYETEERWAWDRRREVWVTRHGYAYECRQKQEEMGGMT